MSESDWFCPKCGRDRRQPYEGEKLIPCCNPKCKGQWGTGCYCCHHPKFLEEDKEIVVTENIYDDHAMLKEIRLQNDLERMTELYEKEFDKRSRMRQWWRGHTVVLHHDRNVAKGSLFVSEQSLADLRNLIADHSFDEAVEVRTKDQRIYALKEELAEKCDELQEAQGELAARIAFEQNIQGQLQEAKDEAFSLSAAHCDHAVGDEHGHLTCKYRELESQLRALIADSKGVSHVHQSEDVAPWDELIESGFLEALKNK